MATKSPKSSSESPSELAATIASEALTVIRDEIRLFSDRKGRSRRHAISRIATLARQAAPIAAEARKAEKADLDAIKRLSPAVVLTWIKAQTAEYRARLVREVSAIDNKERRSVLG